MKSNQSYLTLAVATLVLAAVAYFINLPGPLAIIVGALLGVFFLKPSSSTKQTSASISVSRDDPAGSQTLYVGNLPYRANEKNVRELFAEYGKVLNVRLMKDKRTGKRRGFGFVVVDESDADAMIAALNDHEYMQRTLKVRIANDPKHPTEGNAE